MVKSGTLEFTILSAEDLRIKKNAFLSLKPTCSIPNRARRISTVAVNNGIVNFLLGLSAEAGLDIMDVRWRQERKRLFDLEVVMLLLRAVLLFGRRLRLRGEFGRRVMGTSVAVAGDWCPCLRVHRS
ncbi:hypothetical protein LINGRAHAP2_LOCUS13474 [Linum grandiflorum]